MSFTVPNAVLFDFGGTLAEDSEFDLIRGAGFLRSIALNPEVASTEQICRLWQDFHRSIKSAENPASPFSIETPLPCIFNYIFAVTGLKFDKEPAELEYLFDKNDSDRAPQPYMEQLLDVLNELNIKTAVISNIVMTGAALGRAVNELYPRNRFKHIITSADYCLKKPAPYMFTAAASLLGEDTQSCLYCGDSHGADVNGANAAGMRAVLYDKNAAQDAEYCGDCLRINSWNILAGLLMRGAENGKNTCS